MMSKIFFVVVLFMIFACRQSENVNLIGSYKFVGNNVSKIASLIEVKKDSTFVISGLENNGGAKSTFVFEGYWTVNRDTLIFNSGDYNRDGYGANINMEFLNTLGDSIMYLDQNVMVCSDLKYVIGGDNTLSGVATTTKYAKVK